MCAHRYGVPEPYEKLKAFTRGVAVTQASMQVRLHRLARHRAALTHLIYCAAKASTLMSNK